MLTNIKIGILGAGVEGAALAMYFSGKGFEDICVYDEKANVEFIMPPDVKVVFGEGAFENIYDREILFRSPGIHVNRLFEAKKRGIKISSTIQYFFENSPCKIIGVTGTKGKGTTSTLIYEIFKEAGFDVYLGGNIGEPPINFLDKLNENSIAVLELSSFQLQDLTISPHCAVVLMTTVEHLDYHKDRQEYWEAKKQILHQQRAGDFCVINGDYEYAGDFSKYGLGDKFMISRREKVEKGAYIDNGKIFFRDEGAASGRGKDLMVLEVKDIGLLGSHNQENVLAAVSVSLKFGIDLGVIKKVVRGFTGLPNRLEFVREIDGVKYYNDSFSTTPETSVAGAFAFEDPVLLIAGGSEKFSSFEEWALALQSNEKVKIVFLMGKTADRMEQELRSAEKQLAAKAAEGTFSKKDIEAGIGAFPVEFYRCADLNEALHMAKERAIPGDNVVMSPGAASFGMFKNYKERGQAFRDIVASL
jgi:UDP-N-acetylmuramoylalanine--D-glutamate ligase